MKTSREGAADASHRLLALAKRVCLPKRVRGKIGFLRSVRIRARLINRTQPRQRKRQPSGVGEREEEFWT